MKEHTSIAIVTICYNAASTIRDTLESIASSNYPALEYIVVDGGSTDNTLEIVQEFSEFVTRCVSEPDEGISDAFNKGIGLAESEVVGIISADDLLVEGVLQRIDALAQAHPDVDVFCGDVFALEGDRRTRVRVTRDALEGLYRTMTLKHAGMWIRQRAYERYGGFSQDYRYAMDYELALRFLVEGARFKQVPEVLGLYRTGGINEQQRLAAIGESEAISRRYGYPAWRASLTRWDKVVRHRVKEALPNTVADPLLKVYRGFKRWRAKVSLQS